MRQRLCFLLAKFAGQELTREVAATLVREMFPDDDAASTASPGWEVWSAEGLLDLMCGDADAVRFITDVASCSHVYDDLIDHDKAPSAAAVHQTMWALLIGMPGNPFYVRHQESLRPLLTTGVLNWRAANDMEKSGDLEQLRIAHAIRYAISDVLLMCMVLTGGAEHAAANACRARLMGQNDTWDHYRSEHQPKGN